MIISEPALSPPIENTAFKPHRRNIEIGTTQHFPDFKDADTAGMADICKKAKETGADSLRWNFRWNRVIDENGQINTAGLKHYEDAIKTINGEGLSSTLVISDPPKFIKELARKGKKDEFFKEFQRYMDFMHDSFKKSDTSPKTIQVENELNTGMYNDWIRVGKMNQGSQFGLDDLNRMLTVVREYFPHADRSINVQASNLISALEKKPQLGKIHPVLSGVSAQSFVSELMQKCGNSFEVLGIDYYPGLYWVDKFGKNMFKDMWSNMEPIKWILDRAANKTDAQWGNKKISLSEFGFPSTVSERMQRGFYVYFLRGLDQLVGDYEKLEKDNPGKWRQPLSSIVTYQTMEENDKHTPSIVRPLGVHALDGRAKGEDERKLKPGKVRKEPGNPMQTWVGVDGKTYQAQYKRTTTADILKHVFEARFK